MSNSETSPMSANTRGSSSESDTTSEYEIQISHARIHNLVLQNENDRLWNIIYKLQAENKDLRDAVIHFVSKTKTTLSKEINYNKACDNSMV